MHGGATVAEFEVLLGDFLPLWRAPTLLSGGGVIQVSAAPRRGPLGSTELRDMRDREYDEKVEVSRLRLQLRACDWCGGGASFPQFRRA